MGEYNNLLDQAKLQVKGLRQRLISTARDFIPKMYHALRKENPKITPEDVRDRIQKDCIIMWSKRTILDALPEEAKDQKKQKAGRLRQNEAKSAAFSAAPYKRKEVILDAQGRSVDNSSSLDTKAVSQPTTKSSHLIYNESIDSVTKKETVQNEQKERSANPTFDDDDVSGLIKCINSDKDLQDTAARDENNSEEVVFTIDQDDYDDLAYAMDESNSCCFLIFDNNSGELLGIEYD